jgi:hypothetical protein
MIQPTLIRRIDNLLFRGSSKDTFVQQRIVPANPNDAYYDNKCLLCWCFYDDATHISVRVLPCNHIFGSDCLTEFIGTPIGDTYPVCRTSLFRSLRNVSVERLVDALFDRVDALLNRMQALLYRQQALAPPMEPLAEEMLDRAIQVLWFWINTNNIYYYANLITKHCTHLPARNVDLNLKAAADQYNFLVFLAKIFSWGSGILGWACGTPKSYTFGARLCRAWAIAGFISYWVGHRRIDGLKDRCIFVVVMVAAVLANAVVNLGLAWYSEGF